jgi:hypothetical protein
MRHGRRMKKASSRSPARPRRIEVRFGSRSNLTKSRRRDSRGSKSDCAGKRSKREIRIGYGSGVRTRVLESRARLRELEPRTWNGALATDPPSRRQGESDEELLEKNRVGFFSCGDEERIDD